MENSQNRWLLVEFLPIPTSIPGQQSTRAPEDINSKQIWATLKQSVITHFGDTGWGAVGSSLTSAFVYLRVLCLWFGI